MKIRLEHLLAGGFATLSLFVCGYAFAGDVVSPQDFFALVLEAIKGFGGVSWVLKIASIITIIISSMKVSFLNDLIWSKLGAFKSWVAPILGLIAGILMLSKDGGLTLAGVFAYISAGGGAIILHELLDSIKAIPGLGPTWIWIINMIEASLGKKPDQPVIK